MDSDDEQMLAAEARDIQRGVYQLPKKPAIFIKVFEEEELVARRKRLVVAHRANEMGLPADIDGDYYDLGGMWRIRRLHKSVLGFYEGSLDLAGRSERRWQSIKRHVDDFVSDVKRLRNSMFEARNQSIQIGGTDGRTVTVAFAPSILMEEFKTRYKLGCIDLREILTFPEMIEDAVSSGIGPILQKLFLQDLPPELLLRIFDVIHINDCRALGMTCRAFHELSLAYIYTMRHLVLRINAKYITKRLDKLNKVDIESLRRLRPAMCRSLLADFKFLLSRSDILGRVQKLHIQNMWTDTLHCKVNIFPDQEEQFYLPIYRQIVETLSMTSYLQGFHLNNFSLTTEILQALALLRTLHMLIIHKCSIEKLPTLDTLPAVPAVINLTLAPGHVHGHNMIQIIALFPNVRYLNLLGVAKGGAYTLPDDEFRQKHNPFRTTERANFEHIDDDDVWTLFEWILAAAQTTGLRLTHFRIELECGLSRSEIEELLTALTGAPLRVLALEGIADVKDDLFARLAGAFPALTALTLIHRHNTSQTTSRPSPWPGTTGEYARRLGAFPALRHFMWNFYIWPLRCDTTYDLPLVEAGYPRRLSQEEFEENCYEADWDILPHLFCAYCPTLETLVFTLLHLALMEFTVIRAPYGKLLRSRCREMTNSEQFEKNNPMMSVVPTPFDNSWHFVPSPEHGAGMDA